MQPTLAKLLDISKASSTCAVCTRKQVASNELDQMIMMMNSSNANEEGNHGSESSELIIFKCKNVGQLVSW